jgi:hypothetical protein
MKKLLAVLLSTLPLAMAAEAFEAPHSVAHVRSHHARHVRRHRTLKKKSSHAHRHTRVHAHAHAHRAH